MKQPTAQDARERLAKIPTQKATFIGVMSGIFISIIATLFLKPISVSQLSQGSYTVYSGTQLIWAGSPEGYYFGVGFVFIAAVFATWLVQKRLTIGSGMTLDRIDHGIARPKLDQYVDQLDDALKKLTRHGIIMRELPTEDDIFVRGFQLSDEEETSIIVKIQPFHATVEAPVNDFRALEAVREIIRCLNESQRSRAGGVF